MIRGHAVRVQGGVKGSIGIEEIDIPACVGSQSGARHPDGAFAAIRRQVEHAGLREGRLAVSHEPAGVGALIAVRGPREVDRAVHEQEACAFGILARIEDHVAAGAVGARTRIGCFDLRRAARQLRAGGYVKSMQALVIGAGRIERHADYEDRAIGTGFSIDDRRGRNADLRRDLRAPVVAAGRLIGSEDGCLPDLRSRVSVKCVDAVVFRHRVDDVALLAARSQIREVQRLPIDPPIDRQGLQQAELR